MNATAANRIASDDFGKRAVTKLAKKGITFIGVQAIPDYTSTMPFGNAARGYVVDDNGCGRVWTYQEVRERLA